MTGLRDRKFLLCQHWDNLLLSTPVLVSLGVFHLCPFRFFFLMAAMAIMIKSFDFYSKYNGKLFGGFKKRKGMALFIFYKDNSDIMKHGLYR